LRPAVASLGAIENWQIAIKPGKPLALGHVPRPGGDGAALVIGLPGNPVSSFVTFVLFARPFILRRQGVTQIEPRALPLRADFDLRRADKRREFLRVRLNGAGGLELFGNQNSAVLTSAVWADGLVDNPAGQPIARGNTVRYLPFTELLQ
ncbi:MAG: molybdopterin molybdenumtransferase MoeA, partial [Betaproteobacteria bacterium]